MDRAAFMKELAVSCNVAKAARAAGVSRQRMYQLRQQNADLAREWDEVMNTKLDKIEEHVYRSAEDDPHTARWILSRRRPDQWGDRQTVEHEGVGPITIRNVIPEDGEGE